MRAESPRSREPTQSCANWVSHLSCVPACPGPWRPRPPAPEQHAGLPDLSCDPTPGPHPQTRGFGCVLPASDRPDVTSLSWALRYGTIPTALPAAASLHLAGPICGQARPLATGKSSDVVADKSQPLHSRWELSPHPLCLGFPSKVGLRLFLARLPWDQQ